MENSVLGLLNTDKNRCTGCFACVDACRRGAITIGEDENGFKYPIISENKCSDCGICVRKCPQLNCIEKKRPFLYYGATYLEQDVIQKSSSGGVFYALAQYVLGKQGYVVGAVLTDTFEVKHMITHDRIDLKKMCGSKYVQSNTSGIYREVKNLLDKDELVLFSGVPCQIAALLAFIGGKKKNLITVEILCHGVPNNKVFLDYLNDIISHNGEIEKYVFRDRNLGMRGSNVHIWFKNGHEIINTPEGNSFDRLYSRGYLMRSSCYSCNYARRERLGDIILGDFWGIEKEREDWAQFKGVSIVSINSLLGNKIWDTIKYNFLYFETSYEKCVQESMVRPISKPSDINFFYKCNKRGYKFCVTIFGEFSVISRVYKILKKIKIKLKDIR